MFKDNNLILLKALAAKELISRKEKQKAEFENIMDYYKNNPVDFMVDKLGIKREFLDWSLIKEYENHKWDGTENPLVKILDTLKNKRWVGVESATGTGKTHLGALIVRWFLETHKDSLVVTTAPKEGQLSLHIWKELSKLQQKFPVGEWLNLKLRMNPGREDWVAVGFVAGIKANEESNTKAQGFHAENMLFILEETPGIPEPIITAFEMTCTGANNLILAFGSPNHQFDNLHRFCTRNDVEHIRISAYDHPNVVTNQELIPGAASVVGINRIITKYGSKDHPMALSRTRGICPKQAEDALIQLDWIVNILDNFEPEKFMNGLPALGVDVANSETGDEAAICEGIGAYCVGIDAFQCPDSNRLGKVTVAQRMKEKKIRQENVGVDGVGVGAGTVNALKEAGYKVNNLIGGEKAIVIKDQAEKFNNLRSQMYWQVREDIKNAEVWVPNDPELVADLCAPKWSENDKVIIVESKDEIKKRIGRSPNKGDAFVYWNWVRIKRGNKKIITAGYSIY